MFTMIIGAVTNVALDPIFIFVFKMGIKGASIATDISMAVSATFVISHFLKRNVTVSFRQANFRLRLTTIREIISLGAAPALINTASCFINILIVSTLSSYGDTLDLAAMGIFVTYTSLMVTMMLGISQGLQPILGYNYGAGLYHRLKNVYILAVKASTVIATVATLLTLFVPDIIARLFTSDPGLVEVTARSLRIAVCMFFSVGVQIMTTTLFQSVNRPAESIFLSLCRQVIFLVPLLFVLPVFWGNTGVWMSFPIADLCSLAATMVMAMLFFRRLSKSTVRPANM